MIIKTQDLTGAALDWAVAKSDGMEEFWLQADEFRPQYEAGEYHYSTDWSQAGPIIEREKINVSYDEDYYEWNAGWGCVNKASGDTPLVAAMRCFVASKMGNEVEVPNEVAA